VSSWVQIVAAAAGILWSGAALARPDSGEVSAEQAAAALREGNARFVAGKMEHPNLGYERRTATAAQGQAPFATIVTCSDSRVPVEYIFDRGIGDLFVVRVAGNVCDTDETGTVEYGVGHLHTPLVVVLGHEKCGAVKAVATGESVHGCLPKLVDNILPAVEQARRENPRSSGEPLFSAAVRCNVWRSIQDLLSRSSEVRELVSAGKVQVVGAVYDIESGAVSWLGSHPEQASLCLSAGSHEPAAHVDAAGGRPPQAAPAPTNTPLVAAHPGSEPKPAAGLGGGSHQDGAARDRAEKTAHRPAAAPAVSEDAMEKPAGEAAGVAQRADANDALGGPVNETTSYLIAAAVGAVLSGMSFGAYQCVRKRFAGG
jgi:carbonic anhydrase